jgi:hypothetical protein
VSSELTHVCENVFVCCLKVYVTDSARGFAASDQLCRVRLWDSCTVLQRWSVKVRVILLLNFALHLIEAARGLWGGLADCRRGHIWNEQSRMGTALL